MNMNMNMNNNNNNNNCFTFYNNNNYYNNNNNNGAQQLSNNNNNAQVSAWTVPAPINNLPPYTPGTSPLRRKPRVFTPNKDVNNYDDHSVSAMNIDSNNNPSNSVYPNYSNNSPESKQAPELSASPDTPEPNQFKFNNNKMKQDVVVTTVIFDYDNTIFPTFFLRELFKRKVINNGIVHNPISNPAKYSYRELIARATGDELKELEQLSVITYRMLYQYLQKYGAKNIFIVSAAQQNWMKHSLQIVINIGFYKHIYDLLYNNQDIMISIFNPKCIQLPFDNAEQITSWKFNIFCDLLKRQKLAYNKLINNNSYNILHGFVSLGDGEYEYQAAKMMRPETEDDINDNTYIHRIKLIHHPKLNDLIVQQSQLAQICGVFDLHTLENKTQIDISYDINK